MTLLGGLVDGNYRGRIKAIMANIGRETVLLPKHATFYQGVLLPTNSNPMEPEIVELHGERGAEGGVNRELA